MKKIKFFLPFAALALLASCTDGVKDGPNSGLDEGALMYMSIAITQEATTRTATGSEGTESAQDVEKAVKKALILLADNGKVVAAGKWAAGATDNGTGEFPTELSFTILGEFKAKDLKDAKEDYNYDVFVVCNYNSLVREPLPGDDVQQVLSLTSAEQNSEGIWDSSNGFLMSGKGKVDSSNWATTNKDQDGSKDKPYLLGSVRVVRATARFDIKLTDETVVFGFDENGAETDSDPEVTVTFDQIAVVNMSKTLNLFKEISATASTNWIFSDYKDASESQQYLLVKDPYSNDQIDTKGSLSYEFFYPVLTAGSLTSDTKSAYGPEDQVSSNPIYKWTTITKSSDSYALSDGLNFDEGTIKDNTGKSDWDKYIASYTPWRYVVPSTLYNKSKQLNGNSTGVLFRAKLEFGENCQATTVFTYNNVFFPYTEGSEENLISSIGNSDDEEILLALKRAKDKAQELAEQEAASQDPQEEPVEATNDQIIAQLVKIGGFTKFTRTSTSEDFHCYYYYWNRHNESSEVNGTMEFGVVRNNVYKLAVSTVAKLGHPANPDDDPDPIDPDDPDEEVTKYFQVEVVVLPWSVRINDIEF